MVSAALASPRNAPQISPSENREEQSSTRISTFLYRGNFILVTNARFVPGPKGHVRDGRFTFDRCWNGYAWSASPERAVMFTNRQEALEFLHDTKELILAAC